MAAEPPDPAARPDPDQKPPRLTVASVIAEIADAAFSLERGLPYTVGQLLRHPGSSMRRYIELRDPHLTRPFRLALVCLALAAALLYASGQSEAFMSGVAAGLEQSGKETAGSSAQANAIAQVTLQFFQRFDLILVLCWVPAVASAFQRSYPRLALNFAEAVAFSFYALAIVVLLTLLTTLGSKLWGQALPPWINLLPLLYLPIAAHCYAAPEGHGIPRAVVFVVYATALVLLLMLAVLTVWITVDLLAARGAS